MKNYAMVAINFKEDEKENLLVRRVLIEYKKYKDYKFTGTRFIEKDDYFYDPQKSHQYKFEDDGYTLIDCTDLLSSLTLTDIKRDYHYNKAISEDIKIKDKAEPILIEVASDQEAIKRFKTRTELR